MEKNNITIFNHCYGCGVCIPSCPVKIISLERNKDGFYSPVIKEQNKCIECGICLKVCAYNDDKVCLVTNEVHSYAGWSNDEKTREWCSSGGIGFEIGKYLINKGFKAVGVRYDATKRIAEHFIATTVEEYMPSVGSKYIPSYTAGAFTYIDKTKKYLVTGTPCQIDSFRRYIRLLGKEDNFILLDFFCHGVPSLLLWDEYIREVEKKIGEISYASWRNKSYGWPESWSLNADRINKKNSIDWHDSYNLLIKGKKHLYKSKLSEGDLFYKFFLDDYCLNDCCYEKCKYKLCSSSADIRIGDLWGNTYKDDSKGTSAIISFTDKGEEILRNLGNNSCTLISHTPFIVCEGQMKISPLKPKIRKRILNELKKEHDLKHINNWIITPYRIMRLPIRVKNKILRMIKKSE